MAITNTSIILIKTEKIRETGATQILLKININEIRLNTIICPAVMFANNLIIKVNGLTNMPINSSGAINNFIGTGIPGIQKICFQYCLFPTNVVITKVIKANTPVKAILPLKLALKGKKGIIPMRLLIQIKKNKVKRKGTYFSCFSFPINGKATSSLIKNNNRFS